MHTHIWGGTHRLGDQIHLGYTQDADQHVLCDIEFGTCMTCHTNTQAQQRLAIAFAQAQHDLRRSSRRAQSARQALCHHLHGDFVVVVRLDAVVGKHRAYVQGRPNLYAIVPRRGDQPELRGRKVQVARGRHARCRVWVSKLATYEAALLGGPHWSPMRAAASCCPATSLHECCVAALRASRTTQGPAEWRVA